MISYIDALVIGVAIGLVSLLIGRASVRCENREGCRSYQPAEDGDED